MKKILIVIMSLLMVFFCFGCEGLYIPGPDGGHTDRDDPNKPIDSDQPTSSFTVVLMTEGRTYNPCKEDPDYNPGKPAKARWTAVDGTSVFEAEFDNDGVATAKGLDGDYKVSIWNINNSYTYNPNIYTADNNHRDTKIELVRILATAYSTGSNIYTNIQRINREGVYRAVIDSDWNGVYAANADARYEGIVFFEYQPQKVGRYIVESWVDLTDNEVNPLLEYYISNPAWKNHLNTIDRGGESTTYTKNFKFDMTIEKSNELGNVWGFGIRAENRSGEFPINIDFVVQYQTNASRPDVTGKTVVSPKGPYQDPSLVNAEAQKGDFVYNYKDGLVAEGLCDGSRFRLGKDGFYHLYDATKYAATDGFGPVLFAKISKNCEVFYQDDNELAEEAGNNGGVIPDAGFIKEAGYYCAENISVQRGDLNYRSFLVEYGKKCDSTYGLHAVNEELKQFLQDFADAYGYFADGRGEAERQANLYSTEENMWLFACGYFQY